MSTVSPRICVILNIKRILWTFYLVFWRLFTTNADSFFNLMRFSLCFYFRWSFNREKSVQLARETSSKNFTSKTRNSQKLFNKRKPTRKERRKRTDNSQSRRKLYKGSSQNCVELMLSRDASIVHWQFCLEHIEELTLTVGLSGLHL